MSQHACLPCRTAQSSLTFGIGLTRGSVMKLLKFS
jgi:hypothetical protein